MIADKKDNIKYKWENRPMPGLITNNDAHYAIDMVKAICTQVGPGLPGSTQERERAAIIKKELESHLGAGNVLVEEFTVAPWAFLSAYPLSALFMLYCRPAEYFHGAIYRSLSLAHRLCCPGVLHPLAAAV